MGKSRKKKGSSRLMWNPRHGYVLEEKEAPRREVKKSTKVDIKANDEPISGE